MTNPKTGLWIVPIDDIRSNAPELQPVLRRCGLSTLDIVGLCIGVLDSELGRTESEYLDALAVGITDLIDTVNPTPCTLDQVTLSLCCWTTVEYLKRRLPPNALTLTLDTSRSIKTIHMLITCLEAVE